MLLLARDEEGDPRGMADAQLRDEVLTIFLAGHETSANALGWTWHLLAEHPAVEARLHAELDAVLGNRLPACDDLPRLEYTRMVFQEALRRFPPAWVIGRLALEDHQLGEVRVPAGAMVVISKYLVHHDARFFADPFAFEPERWRSGRQEDKPRFAYFPFGGGPRSCVGEAFAWMEGVLVVAAIAADWQFRSVPSHPLELQPRFTLRPRHGITMTAERRGARAALSP